MPGVSRCHNIGSATRCLLAEPVVVKEYDMHVCTVEDARGVGLAVGEDKGVGAPFDFDIVGRSSSPDAAASSSSDGYAGPISGFAGWFTVDFKGRTDEVGRGVAPEVPNPAYLSTGPEMGCKFYVHIMCLFGLFVYHISLTHRLNHTYSLKTHIGGSRCSIYQVPSPSWLTKQLV